VGGKAPLRKYDIVLWYKLRMGKGEGNDNAWCEHGLTRKEGERERGREGERERGREGERERGREGESAPLMQ
jgi:hypothetical protein